MRALTLEDLNPRNHKLSATQLAAQKRLLFVLNDLQALCGKPLRVTNGVRSWEEHEAIYRRMGRKPPVGSAHLITRGDGKPGLCMAADIWDQDKTLWRWLTADLEAANKEGRSAIVERLGLYLEDGNSTPSWLHVQLNAPASGNRIFIPYAQVRR